MRHQQRLPEVGAGPVQVPLQAARRRTLQRCLPQRPRDGYLISVVRTQRRREECTDHEVERNTKAICSWSCLVCGGECRSDFVTFSPKLLQEQPVMVLLWGKASSLLVVSYR
jgi:hypothetical protein